MSIEHDVRTQLRTLTAEVVGGPDLGRAVRDGRRRRRHRAASSGVAAAAVVGLTVGAACQVAGGTSPRHDPSRVGTAPAYHDFVRGTDLDETFQAAVDEDLPGVGSAQSVAPYDWTHDRPLSDWADATWWGLRYRVGDEALSVELGRPGGPGRNWPSCDNTRSPGDGQPPCDTSDVAGGGFVLSDSFVYADHGDAVYAFTTSFARPDGTVATVQQRVVANSWADAEGRLAFTSTQLRPLVTDTDLVFPDPAS